jgi:thiamine pyrophosphate-dependent acetolactate synthase large subunit-like protein
MRINEAIVRWLESAGVDAAFGDASETVASGIIALQPSRKIKSVVTRNAQAASFAVRGDTVFASQACWGTAVPDAFNRPSGLMLAISHTCLRSQANVTREKTAGVVEILTMRRHGGQGGRGS